MKTRVVLLVALAAAASLTSHAAAGPQAAKQRVVITAKGEPNPTSFGTFTVTPLAVGALKSDSGTETSTWTERDIMRDGQRVTVTDWVTTGKGKRGSFVLRVSIEHINAGNGYTAGVGTWKFVRGTGQYTRLSGGGRVGNAYNDRLWSERREGFLTHQ